VGHARSPRRYLVGGETVVAEIECLGRLENLVVMEEAD
jgi:acylpyruvate hydrolase